MDFDLNLGHGKSENYQPENAVCETLLLVGHLKRYTKPSEVSSFKICLCFVCLCLNRFHSFLSTCRKTLLHRWWLTCQLE